MSVVKAIVVSEIVMPSQSSWRAFSPSLSAFVASLRDLPL